MMCLNKNALLLLGVSVVQVPPILHGFTLGVSMRRILVRFSAFVYSEHSLSIETGTTSTSFSSNRDHVSGWKYPL